MESNFCYFTSWQSASAYIDWVHRQSALIECIEWVLLTVWPIKRRVHIVRMDVRGCESILQYIIHTMGQRRSEKVILGPRHFRPKWVKSHLAHQNPALLPILNPLDFLWWVAGIGGARWFVDITYVIQKYGRYCCNAAAGREGEYIDRKILWIFSLTCTVYSELLY